MWKNGGEDVGKWKPNHQQQEGEDGDDEVRRENGGTIKGKKKNLRDEKRMVEEVGSEHWSCELA